MISRDIAPVLHFVIAFKILHLDFNTHGYTLHYGMLFHYIHQYAFCNIIINNQQTNTRNMPQSLVKNYIHLVFSTKHREPLIHPPYQHELYSYLGGICKTLECQPIKIGGYNDHVHILCLLSRKIALMKLVEEVKTHSSKWMKTKHEKLHNFYWQDGYGAFSINPTEVDTVAAYIENQHEHHTQKTFQEEYRSFLKKYNVDFDERYVWD